MKFPYTLPLYISLISGLLACSTVVDKTYQGVQFDEDQKALFAKPVNAEQIQIDRIKNDGTRRIMDVITEQYSEYRALGSSDFRSTVLSETELRRQAASVGASRVALFEGWVGTVQTGSVGNVVPLRGGGAIGMSTAITKDMSEYHAIFLVAYAGKKERIGIETIKLPADVQQRLERNKGAVVSNVTKGPAFDANILVGDVVIAVNGKQVVDHLSIGGLVRDACRQGGPVVISVLRGAEGRQRDISIPSCV